jgi:hypothetical protein
VSTARAGRPWPRANAWALSPGRTAHVIGGASRPASGRENPHPLLVDRDFDVFAHQPIGHAVADRIHIDHRLVRHALSVGVDRSSSGRQSLTRQQLAAMCSARHHVELEIPVSVISGYGRYQGVRTRSRVEAPVGRTAHPVTAPTPVRGTAPSSANRLKCVRWPTGVPYRLLVSAALSPEEREWIKGTWIENPTRAAAASTSSPPKVGECSSTSRGPSIHSSARCDK